VVFEPPSNAGASHRSVQASLTSIALPKTMMVATMLSDADHSANSEVTSKSIYRLAVDQWPPSGGPLRRFRMRSQ
jgi:hypothetical protein